MKALCRAQERIEEAQEVASFDGVALLRRRLPSKNIGLGQLKVFAPMPRDAIAPPPRHRLRNNAHQGSSFGGPPKGVDDGVVDRQIWSHAHSVITITNDAQSKLQNMRDHSDMDRSSTTEAGRVRWAIARSGRTLQDIAAQLGCTHATLSQWQNGKASLQHSRYGLVSQFATATGVSIGWLVNGVGEPIQVQRAADHPCVTAARDLAAASPVLAEHALRILEALRASTPTKHA